MKTYKYNYLLCLMLIATTGKVVAQDTMLQPVDIGCKSLSFSYTDTKNTALFINDYVGRTTNDVFYKFSITVAMDIIVSHCGSALNDTYLHILNVSGTRIAYCDDYYGVDKCINGYHSYIKMTNVAPGTYFIVSEGYSQNGNITTTIEGIKPLPPTGLYDGSAVTGTANSGQNYIQTITPTVATSDVSGLGINESLQTIQYFDGLGRPVQTVQRCITPTKQDLATFTEYDGAGRNNLQWLPIPTTGNGALTPKSEFTNGSSVYGSDSRRFKETVYEPSALNRIEKQYGQGQAWADHPVCMNYDTNNDQIAYYFVNTLGNLQRGSNYTSGMLYKTSSTDEDGKIATEYKDKLGRLIMKQSSTDVQTYYVYNDLSQLSYIIPPKAADNLTAQIPYQDDNINLKQFCFLYKYDERGNCIEKRLPGCESIFMVYDKANRLTMSQDGNQRAKIPKQWTVIKYDFLGRMLYMGIINRDVTSTEKSDVHNAVITETYTGSSSFKSTGYSWTGLSLSVDDFLPLTVNYYDDYSFTSITPNGSYLNWLSPPTNITQPPSTTAIVFNNNFNNAKGLITGTRTYLLDGSVNYISTALYYDYMGKIVQSRSSNHMGGYDIVYNALNFNGIILCTYKTHGINGATDTYKELYTYTYDHAQRPLTTTYSINGATAVILSDMTASGSYDELGRLKTKKRHNGTDTESYDYNIRNWTTRIASGSFTEELFYNECNLSVARTPCFNGNISISTWTYGSGKNAYTYTYDALNRLNRADGYQVQGGFFLFSSGNMEEFTYDKQGNINSLNRQKGAAYIDKLELNYKGNQLDYVTDLSGSQNMASVKEYQNKSAATSNEFSYDANGNITKDLDREIVTIRYNVLNLPEIVQFRNGNQIKYLYDARGQKLKVDYFTCLTTITPIQETQVGNWTYTPNVIDKFSNVFIGNMMYRLTNGVGYTDNPILNQIENPEGYSSSSGQKYYYRRDHLGSIREVWWQYRNLTMQSTQYYPSGLPWAEGTGVGTQLNKYNGKLWDEMHGWDEHDLGWRGIYNAIMSFDRFDPFAEKKPWISPYVFCSNNPVNSPYVCKIKPMQ